MKKFAVFFSVMAVLFFGFFSTVTASIITFDNPPLPTEGYEILTNNLYTEGGIVFRFATVRSNPGVDAGMYYYDDSEWPMGPSPEGDGTPFLYSNYQEIRMNSAESSSFDIAYFECFPYDGYGLHISVLGNVYLPDGIGDTITYRKEVDIPEGIMEIIRVNLWWEGMDQVELMVTQGFPCIDNVAVNQPVPIPGAVWLLGSGVVGLIGLKKRRR